MSYRVGTENYNLPQTEGTDKRDWFDTNESFRKVDEDLHACVQGVGTQSATIEAIQTDVGNLQTGLEDTNTEVSGIKTKQVTDEENIAQNAQAISQLNGKVDALDTDLAEMIEVTEEESATATVQHAVGTYFRYNDNLWITTVLIRVGDEIVPNVNCETTDVMTRVYNLEHAGGGSVDASAVTFDNTGTDLISTNVEAVVKEVNTKTDGAIDDLGELKFRVDNDTAQYSKDGGTNWVNFKNPVGTKSITANGTYDVTDYASASVRVVDKALDIDNAVLLTASDQTASKDGAIFGSFSLSGGQGSSVRVHIKVDGAVIAGTISGFPCGNICFPIAQGQTYRYDANGSINYNKVYYAPFLN